MAASKLRSYFPFAYMLTIFLSFSSASAAKYTLMTNADRSNFFSLFNFFPSLTNAEGVRDWTNGFVNYLDQSQAFSSGRANIVNGKIRLAADNTKVLNSRLQVQDPRYGRDSVRVESKFTFDNGLLMLDFTHMPPADCGVWSSFWTINNQADDLGSGNPALYAEIDIIEGANKQTNNVVSLHTDQRESCSFTGNGRHTGIRGQNNCQLNEGSGAGCEVEGPGGSYGADINRAGGGIYAVEVKSSAIRVWFIPRSNISIDISSGEPNPDSWQTPVATYDAAEGGCDIETLYKNQTTVLNIDFCGDNGDGTWSTGDNSCRKLTGFKSCKEFVAKNPAAFSETYWEINSLKLYR